MTRAREEYGRVHNKKRTKLRQRLEALFLSQCLDDGFADKILDNNSAYVDTLLEKLPISTTKRLLPQADPVYHSGFVVDPLAWALKKYNRTQQCENK